MGLPASAGAASAPRVSAAASPAMVSRVRAVVRCMPFSVAPASPPGRSQPNHCARESKARWAVGTPRGTLRAVESLEDNPTRPHPTSRPHCPGHGTRCGCLATGGVSGHQFRGRRRLSRSCRRAPSRRTARSPRGPRPRRAGPPASPRGAGTSPSGSAARADAQQARRRVPPRPGPSCSGRRWGERQVRPEQLADEGHVAEDCVSPAW